MSREIKKKSVMKNTMSKFILVGLLFSTYELYSQCAESINIYSFSYGGKNYEVVKEMKSWVDASSCAVERAGYLVEINDIDEQAAVYNAISSAGVSPTYTVVNNGGGIAYVWIGATDQSDEGTWLWDGNNDDTGTNFWLGQGANGSGGGSSVEGLYYNWGGQSTGTPNEPDNYGAGQNHAAIGLAGWPSGTTALGIAGEWNDIIGSSQLYFIIEKGSGVGINDRVFQNDIYIFPNPSTDKLCVEGLNLNEENTYAIHDNTGRVLAGGVFINTNEIDISDIAKGMYVLKIEGASHSSFTFIKE